MLKNLLVAAALGLAAPAAPALADHSGPTVSVQLGVYGSDHRRGRWDRDISRWEAIRIASSQGVFRVHDVELRRGVWEVAGQTRRGGRIEVEIAARTGRVIDIDYGRGRGRGWDDDRRGRDRGGWD